MTVNLSLLGGAGWQFSDNNGNPLSGGLLYTYAAGTTTPQTTYTSISGVTANTNPVVLDAAGRVSGEIWLTEGQLYKFVLKNSAGVTIGTYDNVPGVVNSADIYAALAASSGSSLIGYQPAGTGAVATTVQTKLRQTVSVMDFAGIDPTGVSDSTVGIQAAVTFARAQGGESRKLYWPRGTYLITNTIILGTNQYIEFDPGVTINFVPIDPLNTPMFVAANQSEVYLDGNGATLIGTRGTVAGQGSGNAIELYGTDNATVRNFVIKDFATDGIIIWGDTSGSGPCTNVLIENCTVDNCRRNGMSIISAIGCIVLGGAYTGTNGALGGPCAGIDIEPNTDCFLENVNLIGVSTGNNAGAGLQFTPGALSPNIARRFNVNVTGGRSVNDGDLVGTSGLYFANGGALINKIFGEIVVRGFTVENPKSRGVNFREWEDDKCPCVVLEDITVYNPDATSSAIAFADRSGFVMRLDSGQTATTMGNITMRNCLAEDTRSPPRMMFGMLASSDAGKQVKNVTVIDPRSINFVAGNKFDIYTATAEGPGTSNAFDVFYTRPTPVDESVSLSIAGYGGKRVNATTSGIVLTLPFASNCNGMVYEIQNAPGVNSVTVALQAGDTILGDVNVASVGLVLDAGGFLRLRSRGSASWTVEALDGLSRIPGMSFQRKIQFNNAIPVGGTWAQGDIIFNSIATVGQPVGWQCTVSGTPGTWVAMANL
jgi:hypothetical protein